MITAAAALPLAGRIAADLAAGDQPGPGTPPTARPARPTPVHPNDQAIPSSTGGWGSERWRDTSLAALAEVFSC